MTTVRAHRHVLRVRRTGCPWSGQFGAGFSRCGMGGCASSWPGGDHPAGGRPISDRPPIHLGARAIQTAVRSNVIVMANDAGDAMGSWGGLLSLAARLKGVTGVVSNGGCRDVDEARELNFPVFARRAAVRTARGRAHEVSCGEPVELDSVTIRNGDIVVADGTGVVVVGADYAIDVVRRAEEIWRKERTMQTRLRAGSNVQDVLGGSYELMLTENA